MPTYISTRLDDIALRTERGAEIIRREPREIPRRLRGLLLAIDGRQTVRTYINKLEGFGEVDVLLSELATLGLIELRSGPRQQRNKSMDDMDSVFNDDSVFGGFVSAEAVMSDRAQLFQTVADTTMTGMFDELVRVAQLDNRDYRPPPRAVPAPPEPVLQKQVQAQVESLFAMLEATRNERKTLKDRIGQLHKYRAMYKSLKAKNERLIESVFALGGSCVFLLGLVVFMQLYRR